MQVWTWASVLTASLTHFVNRVLFNHSVSKRNSTNQAWL